MFQVGLQFGAVYSVYGKPKQVSEAIGRLHQLALTSTPLVKLRIDDVPPLCQRGLAKKRMAMHYIYTGPQADAFDPVFEAVRQHGLDALTHASRFLDLQSRVAAHIGHKGYPQPEEFKDEILGIEFQRFIETFPKAPDCLDAFYNALPLPIPAYEASELLKQLKLNRFDIENGRPTSPPN